MESFLCPGKKIRMGMNRGNSALRTSAVLKLQPQVSNRMPFNLACQSSSPSMEPPSGPSPVQILLFTSPDYRAAAAAFTACFLPARYSTQPSTMGAAMAMEEYVPIKIPTTRQKANP